MSTGTDKQKVKGTQKNTGGTMLFLQTTERRIRSASLSTAARLLDYNPAAGMWQATGTAIAHAPNITDLRSPDAVEFDIHGRSIRRVGTQAAGGASKAPKMTAILAEPYLSENKEVAGGSNELPSSARSDHSGISKKDQEKFSRCKALKKGLVATWRFTCTPTGLFILVYGLNVIAWGAMLFFLLLNILNGLFCLTSWGLAPWRIRDTYWLLMWRIGWGERSRSSIKHLAKGSTSWFRMRNCDTEENCDEIPLRKTLTGKSAPATKTWKMDFVVINMLLNSLFQIGMATFMWEYNRNTRPSFGVGLFIGLGCSSSLLAGVMTWWEGRKVKMIEGSILEEITEEHEKKIVLVNVP
ncbi:hypothetical protein N7509_008266 [Penicillium cosmopolitanum]|uniref:Uncharacterized protein n=1 Tax=Penicillium cosmopolitanum TaxID=1131564 RepID=A0A9W9VMA3_9EURO|nr:uncharacterized protein N7509_008266 [Penicillium cosmopolitanum]KAJ5385725.1 hypothetical protein N7509_008266 [Penicillium cosmopolitanum]